MTLGVISRQIRKLESIQGRKHEELKTNQSELMKALKVNQELLLQALENMQLEHVKLKSELVELKIKLNTCDLTKNAEPTWGDKIVECGNESVNVVESERGEHILEGNVIQRRKKMNKVLDVNGMVNEMESGMKKGNGSGMENRMRSDIGSGIESGVESCSAPVNRNTTERGHEQLISEHVGSNIDDADFPYLGENWSNVESLKEIKKGEIQSAIAVTGVSAKVGKTNKGEEKEKTISDAGVTGDEVGSASEIRKCYKVTGNTKTPEVPCITQPQVEAGSNIEATNECVSREMSVEGEKKHGEVLVIGDSLLKFAGDICRKRGQKVRCYPGVRLRELAAIVKWDDEIFKEEKRIVLIHAGTNDLKGRVPAEHLMRDMMDLLEAI